MIFSLVKLIPWGLDLSTDKRIVRTFIIGCVCYMLLYLVVSMNYFIQNQTIILILNTIHKCFWGFFATDLSLFYAMNKNSLGFDVIKRMTGMFGGEKEKKLIPQSENSPQTLVVKQEPVLKQVENKKNDKVELDIDLLTEDNVEPDVTEVKKPELEPQEIKGETSAETIQDEGKSTVENREEKQSEKQSECPKLTQDNINKYVKNKAKIKLHASVKSEDLNL